jgi:predicted alpha/beta-hydrolase family hydrolase
VDHSHLETELAFERTPALAIVPEAATWLYVLGHGAGAGMRHAFMVDVAHALADRGVATLRWEMPFMAAKRKRPDPAPVCEAAARLVCRNAAERFPALRLCAGGKSMGGRMTSQAQSQQPLPRVEALAFLGFPLHPADEPGLERAQHLTRIDLPMLFVWGSRDELAQGRYMRPVIAGLGARATLAEIAHADHGFDVLVKSGLTAGDVIGQIADRFVAWLDRIPVRQSTGS